MTLLEDQTSTLELLVAMYPLPSELSLSPETSGYLHDGLLASSLSEFSLTLSLAVDDDQDAPLELVVSLPLRPDHPPPYCTISIRHPAWLPRAQYEFLLQSLPPSAENSTSSEYLLPILEMIPGEVIRILKHLRQNSATQPPALTLRPESMGRLGWGEEERVWYWFPSLSSKEKRGDLVDYAEEMGITGFVLAGKPGILCVEGQGHVIDKYMSKIKSVSWADVPAFQKKVTERLRVPVPCPVDRLFATMSDITSKIKHNGQYNHRGDMSEMQKVMNDAGAGAEFTVVIMNQPSG